MNLQYKFQSKLENTDETIMLYIEKNRFSIVILV
jgi:hypothetical protein